MRRLRLSLLCGVLGACAGPAAGGPGPEPIRGTTPAGAPRWVNRGSGAFSGAEGKAFYGVGLVAGIANPALARQTADNRARGEIAKIFDLYVAAMMKDYQRSTSAGGTSSAEEQDVVSAQKTVTETTVRGIEVRDHWTDPQGTLYALAVLPLDRVMKNTGKLSPTLRDHVRKNARRAFADLDRELAKRGRREAGQPPAPSDAPAPPPPSTTDPPPPPKPQPTPEAAPPPIVKKKKGKLRVGLRISGRDSKKIQTCFASEIINAGFELIETSNDVDVMVRGSLRFKRAARNNAAQMVRASLDVRVLDMDSGKTLAAEAREIKVGRPTLREALQTSVAKLCKLVTPKVVGQIKAAFVR